MKLAKRIPLLKRVQGALAQRKPRVHTLFGGGGGGYSCSPNSSTYGRSEPYPGFLVERGFPRNPNYSLGHPVHRNTLHHMLKERNFPLKKDSLERPQESSAVYDLHYNWCHSFVCAEVGRAPVHAWEEEIGRSDVYFQGKEPILHGFLGEFFIPYETNLTRYVSELIPEISANPKEHIFFGNISGWYSGREEEDKDRRSRLWKNLSQLSTLFTQSVNPHSPLSPSREIKKLLDETTDDGGVTWHGYAITAESFTGKQVLIVPETYDVCKVRQGFRRVESTQSRELVMAFAKEMLRYAKISYKQISRAQMDELYKKRIPALVREIQLAGREEDLETLVEPFKEMYDAIGFSAAEQEFHDAFVDACAKYGFEPSYTAPENYRDRIALKTLFDVRMGFGHAEKVQARTPKNLLLTE